MKAAKNLLEVDNVNIDWQNKLWHYALSIFGGIIYGLFIVNVYSRYEDYKAIIVAAVLSVLSLSLCAKNIRRFFLILLVFFLPFNTTLLKQNIGPSADFFLSLADLPLFILVILWIADSAIAKSAGHRLSKMVLPALCLIAWSALSITNSFNVSVSIVELIRLIKILLLFLCISYHIKTKKDVEWVVVALLFGVVLQFLLSYGQVVFGTSQVVRKLGGLTETYLSSYGSEEITGVIRFSGTVGHPNGFGAYLVFLIPLSISLSLSRIKAFYKTICHIVSVVGIIALIFSFSRAAWIGFVVSIFMLIYFRFKKRPEEKNIIANAIIVLFVLFFLLMSFYGMVTARVSGGDRGSAQSRFVKWQGALTVMAAHPVLGAGLNNFGLVVNRYFPYYEPPEDSVEKDPHNGYLRIAAETGIIGLLFFIWLLVALFREGLLCLKSNDEYLYAVVVGILAGFSGFLVDVFFGPQYWENIGRLLFWFMAGFVAALTRIISSARKNESHYFYLR